MSIQRCEYEFDAIKGGIEGTICRLNGRGCMIADLEKVNRCDRRRWANLYRAKYEGNAPEAARTDRQAGVIEMVPSSFKKQFFTKQTF